MTTIPMELLTLGVSTIGSGLLALFSQSMKLKAQHQSFLMAQSQWHADVINKAREYNPKGINFTRRTLAIMIVFSVVVLPKLVAFFFPHVPVLIGYTEFHPGFWIFGEHTSVEWKAFTGISLTPLDTNLASAVIGFYFGPSIVKNV